jgi:hypothetical protein
MAWREQFEYRGCHALFDRRRQMPSPRRAPAAEVERVLRLYRERYRGFNVRHFYDMARREHQVQVSYSWVKDALQLAGLVPKTGRAGGIGGGASPGRASGSSCTSMGVRMRGSPSPRTSGRP